MKSALGWIFVACWLLSMTNAASSQAQVPLFGTVIVPVLTFKVMLVGMVSLSWLVWPEWRDSKGVLVTWFVFLLCVLTSAVAVHLRGEMPISEQTVGFLTIYLYMIAVPVFLLTKPLIRLSQISAVICVSFVPLVFLGLAQYWLNAPIVATGTPDDSLYITSWSFYGQVRAFSLFASGLDFAFFLALAAGIFSAFLLGPGSSILKRVFAAIGLLLAAVATYATITRVAYLFVPMTVVFSAFLSRRKMVSRAIWFLMPVAALLVGIVVVVGLPLYFRQMNAAWLSDESLLLRLHYWGQGLEAWLGDGSLAFWFGSGAAPGPANPDYIVDNTFLSFAVQSGTVGLCGAAIFMLGIWMSLRGLIHANTRPEVIAFTAFWATFMLTGMFNVVSATYFLAILPLLNSGAMERAPRPVVPQVASTPTKAT